MPLLTKLRSRSSATKEKEAVAQRAATSERSPPPPAYTTDAPPYSKDDIETPPSLTAGFSNLRVTADDSPNREQCIAHLKLLECFYRLRQNVSSTDGLFGIYNHALTSANGNQQCDDPNALSLLGEKRWAVYVYKAVDRFERWRDVVAAPQQRLKSGDTDKGGVLGTLVSTKKVYNMLDFSPDNLPPIDVLMVWHSYMLNPRAYLEDCIREGRMSLWATDMPWQAVAEVIDSDTFEYKPSPAAIESYTANTGDAWNSLQGSETKAFSCPHCSARSTAVWTSVGETEPRQSAALLDAVKVWLVGGKGYTDPDFEVRCENCKKLINRDALIVKRFMTDISNLRRDDICMPGTVLGPDAGLPRQVEIHGKVHLDYSCITGFQFSNQLLKGYTGEYFLRIEKEQPTFDILKVKLESALQDSKILKEARGSSSKRLSRGERISIRRMMSRYWNNDSPFALDLVGAVIRQGTFVEKMHGIDWLHSPALYNTMSRLITRYHRFFQILSTDKTHMAVPTLDIDLAWHTHQLRPSTYLFSSVTQTSQFIDHDDKVAETRLNDSFAHTSKLYQKLFSEPYSECTCWYCEAVRESHTSTASRLFKTRSATAADNLHVPETDPKKSVHISAHNAVAPTDDAAYDERARKNAQALEEAYLHACQRAERNGRKKPRRDDYYYSDAYGYPVYMLAYAPYTMGAGFGYTGAAYAVNPGCMALAPGAAGNCCAGTCGGGVAAGGCASGGAGGCAGGAAGGCGGGAGGACGGGGGGGCGGGGGGGGC